ncbi:MAG: hypothetical protein U0V48_11365 [Anaerolineales bacterium]
MPPFLCLSNGLSNEGLIADVLGKDKVIHGTVTTAVGKHECGRCCVGTSARHRHCKEILVRLLVAFDNALLNPRLFADAASMKWSKHELDLQPDLRDSRHERV